MSDATVTMQNPTEWEAWLEQNGATSPGVWLRLAKRGAELPTVTYAEALEVALCFGWIDGQKRAEDERYWLQRFTPRTRKSVWSKINKAKAEALIASGRVRPAGLQEIERAKKDGRWDAAYASASTATVPSDLQEALDDNPKARELFAKLNSQNRYAVLYRIHAAKKPETRARKIAQFVEMLGKGEKIYP
jgi:uncharacterized protein YdeI (YjbR/CyaY-like superfamily)